MFSKTSVPEQLKLNDSCSILNVLHKRFNVVSGHKDMMVDKERNILRIFSQINFEIYLKLQNFLRLHNIRCTFPGAHHNVFCLSVQSLVSCTDVPNS